ncbi:MAG: hypothetical protein LBI49_12795 [Nocardiopsaceae bacterium]|jgi:hypothetical protein|nr:hypothetical protein [Nocardiopsaceae bacterium]
MPCYRCGARQVDPARGASPWKRGVRSNQQVLVCPDCQGSHDWAADLDRCARCHSTRLVRRLGEVECRDCGFVAEPAEAGSDGAAGEPSGLAEEVSRALERVLGRRTGAEV